MPADGPDLEGLNTSLRDDWRKFKRLRERENNDLSPGLALELVAGAATVLGLLGWLLALAIVPEPLSGTVWMGAGLLLLGTGAVVTGVAHVARVIGVDGLRAVVREVVP